MSFILLSSRLYLNETCYIGIFIIVCFHSESFLGITDTAQSHEQDQNKSQS